MDNTGTLYIVNFGDSAKYRLLVTENNFSLLNDVRDEVERFLRNHFRSEELPRFYREPHLQKIEEDHVVDYDGYPDLSLDVVGDIEKVLLTEVRNYNDVEEDILNAPFDDL